MSDKQPLQGRPFDGPAGEAAIVILVREAYPSLVLLAGDVGFGALPLGVEAVELLLQAFLGALAGVDGAPDRLLLDLSGFDVTSIAHGFLWAVVRPKNR